MNKTDFIKAVAAKADLSIKDATAAVEAFADVVADALKAGDKVAIAGFGTFEIKEKAERSAIALRSDGAAARCERTVRLFGKTDDESDAEPL